MKKYLGKVKKYLRYNRWPLILMRAWQGLNFIDHDLNLAYSQEGEDLILNSYFINQPKGFYVDIGANHPKKFSNTHRFYLKGWQGINIDPWPEAEKLFKKYRPDDVFVNCGISDKDGYADYYRFRSALMNTFNEIEAKQLKQNPDEGCRLQKTIKVKVGRLQDILREYENFIAGRRIDFMNIDVEGGEMAVLKSNDWDKYLPGFMAIEIHGFDLNNMKSSGVHNYLTERNYQIVAKTQLSAIYKHKFYEF